MTRRQILIVAAVAGGIILVCAVVGVVGYALMNVPLAPALNVPTSAPLPAGQITPGVPTAEIPPAVPTATVAPSGQVSNCGNTGSTNILVVGVDVPWPGIKGPAAIRIVRVDFSNKKASVFSFPRDLWIPITGLEAFGFTQARLGESYLIARGNAGQSVAGATNLLAQNLNKNFGAVSNHYVTGSLTSLSAIIDSVGGITVNVPVDYDGTPYGHHYFPAGPYYMKGSLAMEYAIAPSATAQWSGADRQTAVLLALFQKIFSPEFIPRIPSLIPQFLQAVTTDLSLQQIMDLVCISQQIPGSQITFSGVGAGDVTMGASGVLYPNTDAIRAKVKQFLG